MINFSQFVEKKDADKEDKYVEKGSAVEPADRRLLASKLKQHRKTHGTDDSKLRGKAAAERDALNIGTITQGRSHRKRYGGK